jgi:hypothetical protein
VAPARKAIDVRTARGRTAHAIAFARSHWPLLSLFALAAAIRVLVAIAYRPAVFYSDSWAYVQMAFGPGHTAPDRPSGYPALMWAIGLPGRSLVAVTTLQHVAGLFTAGLSYALLRRFGVGRWAATAATALIALDGYAIGLEQTILAEAFFTVTLVFGAFLAAGRDRSGVAVAASGAALAAAATMRTAALFAVPAWCAYVLLRHRRLRVVAFALAALLTPLLAYGAAYKASEGRFGLTSSDGWFLYGRVGNIADCSKFKPPAGTADLCEPTGRSKGEGPTYYLWSGRSPANRKYGSPTGPAGSAPLKRFAIAVIRARPGTYAEIVARDFARYFLPGAGLPSESATIQLPASPLDELPRESRSIRAAYLPNYVPSVHAPAAVVRRYHAVVHPPRPLLALLVLATLGTLTLALVGPRRGTPPRWAESLLLTGMGVGLLVGSVLTSSFIVRYLVPAVPLIVCGGTLALTDIVALRRAR